jgi:hypothetical protein
MHGITYYQVCRPTHSLTSSLPLSVLSSSTRVSLHESPCCGNYQFSSRNAYSESLFYHSTLILSSLGWGEDKHMYRCAHKQIIGQGCVVRGRILPWKELNSRNQNVLFLSLQSGLAAVFGCNIVAAIYTFFAYSEEDGGWGKTYVVCE